LRGQLRITCSVSFAYAQIAAAIVDFLKLHPQLKVDLNASEGALNLVETRIDLAIRISAEPDPALIGRVLAPCTSVLVASPAYLADRGVPLVE
jgi:DNA-binding transcriptional LysR family regulator